MVFDVARVRGLYTSLSDGWTYLNATGTPQVPEQVSGAVARCFRSSTVLEPVAFGVEDAAGSHSRVHSAHLPMASRHIASARRALADLCGVGPDCVILGPSLEVLYAQLSEAVRPLMRRGATLVTSRADKLRITGDYEQSFAESDLGTGEVPAFQFEKLVDGATRLVTISAAHRTVGNINPVEEIAEIVHRKSRAWVVVDASGIAGIRSVQLDDLGADIVALDCAAFGGPDIAALVFRDERMFPRVNADAFTEKVSPGLAGGVDAVVDHIASLDESARGTRKKRLASSVAAAGNYMHYLGGYLVDSLSALPSVHVFGVSGEAAAGSTVDRIPVATFFIGHVPAITIHRRLIEHHLVTTMLESDPLLRDMGISDTRGVISVGLGPYNTTHDVDQLVRVVASLA